jgi:hypothetical protein
MEMEQLATVIGNIVGAPNKMQIICSVILCVITSAYVIITGCICSYNRKAIETSERQIEETKNIQRQNVKINLFEKRYDEAVLEHM